MNKVIKVAMSKGYNVQHMNENYIQEYARVINSKAKTKQEYKSPHDVCDDCGEIVKPDQWSKDIREQVFLCIDCA